MLSADWGKVKQGIECLEEATKEKETKYQRMVNLDEFMVFGATTFGSLNEHAQSILLEIGRAYTTATPSEEEAMEDQCHITQQLLMVLNKVVAHMLRSALPEVTSVKSKLYILQFASIIHHTGTMRYIA